MNRALEAARFEEVMFIVTGKEVEMRFFFLEYFVRDTLHKKKCINNYLIFQVIIIYDSFLNNLFLYVFLYLLEFDNDVTLKSFCIQRTKQFSYFRKYFRNIFALDVEVPLLIFPNVFEHFLKFQLIFRVPNSPRSTIITTNYKIQILIITILPITPL